VLHIITQNFVINGEETRNFKNILLRQSELCAGVKVSLILTHSLLYLYLILLLHNIALSCKWITSCELQVGKTARIADVE